MSLLVRIRRHVEACSPTDAAPLRLVLAGVLLSRDPEEGFALLAGAPGRAREAVLLHAARSRGARVGGLVEAVRAWAESLQGAATPERVALALWSGAAPDSRVLAGVHPLAFATGVRLTLDWGWPAGWETACAFAAERLEGPALERARLALLEARRPELEDAERLWDKLIDPWARLRGLAAMAASGDADEERRRRWLEASLTLEDAVREQWGPFEASRLLGSVALGVDDSSVTAALRTCWRAIEGHRHEALRAGMIERLLPLCARAGLTNWRDAVERLVRDRSLTGDPAARARVLAETAVSAELLPRAVRASGIDTLHDLASAVKLFPPLVAVVHGVVATLTHERAELRPYNALDRLEQLLKTHGAHSGWPAVARRLGQRVWRVDAKRAEAMALPLSDAARGLWWIGALEASTPGH